MTLRRMPGRPRDNGAVIAYSRASRVFAATLAAASLSFAISVRAQVKLDWDAPPECPQGHDVVHRIRSLTGSTFDRGESFSAQGRIVRVDRRYWLTILVQEGGETRKRQIASDSCANLAGAAAVTIAILLGAELGGIVADDGAKAAGPADGSPTGSSDANESSASNADPSRATGRNDAAAEANRRVEVRREAEKGAETEESDDDDHRDSADGGADRSWEFLLQVPAVALDVGPLPRPSLGLGGGIGFRYAPWRVLATGNIFRDQAIDKPGPSGELGVELTRLGAQLLVCHGFRTGPVELAPCAGLSAERLSARGYGSGVTSRTENAHWLAATAGALAHIYPLEFVALFVSVTGSVELSRPTLVIERFGEIQQLAPVSAGFSMGLEWIL